MIRILQGDCRSVLPTLADGSVQCCVTSPPYFGLRSYLPEGHADKNKEVGAETTPGEFIAALVDVFREVRRVLRDDGTIWINLGDSFSSGNGTKQTGRNDQGGACSSSRLWPKQNGLPGNALITGSKIRLETGLASKQLLMIPARVAIALQADGWYLRSDCIWHKPNPMPEPVTDRPTSAHEHVFLLTKRASYFYDSAAVREENSNPNLSEDIKHWSERANNGEWVSETGGRMGSVKNGRNLRNVWTIASQPFSGAHHAVMPPELAERCIKAGSKPGDTVLDPFSGSGTTSMVADRLQRHAIGIELNPAYAAMSTDRLTQDAGLFAELSA